ncbi:hypothetical protein IAU60_004074 [Kwoniella sp. DSM 27419]
MSLMDSNAIQIAVRTRPWHPEKEVPFLAVVNDQPYFGDGGLGSGASKTVAPGALRNVVDVIDNRMLDFDKPQGPNEGRGGPFAAGRRYKNRKYVFDQVFGMDATQDEVFEKTAKPLLPGILDGYNATVFAYGATGCGKTHTISGTEEQPGIIIKTMKELFDLVEETKLQVDTYFQMSMVEIYNETIRDLLSDDYPACPPGGLKLLENEASRVKVAHVTELTPKTVDEVMSLVRVGNERRSTSFTARNSTSSRSHLVLQINVVRNLRSADVDMSDLKCMQQSTSATLSIIDLAGSEKASVNRGQRMKEGANINKSLLALSGCISALCQPPVRGVRSHVPYRDSKLTRLLKFSLGGNCRTVMINCISPSSRDIEETNNTLLWADKAKKVSTKVSRNTAGVELRTVQYLQKILTLEETIKSLEKQLEKAQLEMSGIMKRKLDSARANAQGEINVVQDELDQLLPVILEGSEMEALWNASVLQVEALETRLMDIDIEVEAGRPAEEAQQEKDHLRLLIRQQDQAYRSNSEIEAGRQGKSIKLITLNNLFKKAEERHFDEGLAEAKYEHQLAVSKRQAHVSRSVAAASERALRDFIAQQADTTTRSASILSRFSTKLRGQVAFLCANPSLDSATMMAKMQDLVTAVDADVATLFGETPAPFSVGSARLPVSLAAPSPRRASIRPSTYRESPAKPTPLRRSLFPSVGTSSTPTSIPAPVSGTTKDRVRWADDTSSGKLDDRSTALDCPVFSSPSDVGNGSVADLTADSVSNVWAEPKPRQPAPPAPVIPTALRPLGRPSLAGPPPVASSAPAEIPAWKQNRIMRGLVQPIDTIAEESSPKLSPSGPSRLPVSSAGLMGPPARVARPGPLAELNNQPAPGLRPSPSSTSSTSNLLKPTASSAARASLSAPVPSAFSQVKIAMSNLALGDPNASATGPPSTALRRQSVAGPSRHERTRVRYSVIGSHGPPGEVSFAGSAVGGSAGVGNTSALSGGARRIVSAKPRMSVQPGGQGTIMPASLRGSLASRPSMAKLNGVAAGDGAKPVWK